MSRLVIWFAALALASCATAPRVAQREVPPPRPQWVPRAPEERPVTDEAATQRFLDQEIERQTPAPRLPAPHADRYRARAQDPTPPAATDEAATNRFLDTEIERRRTVQAVPEPTYVVERVYEPVYVDRVEYRDVGSWEYRQYRSRFPWNTAVGAGLGAIIGHQSGRRDRGAAIGAGVGLLFDIARWH